MPAAPSSDLSTASYRALAEFRHQIRRFLRFSEEAAREHGLEPHQHQLLLAIKGLPEGREPTIREIADRLQIRHHSAVELADRMVKRGSIARIQSPGDAREVHLHLTPKGEQALRRLSVEHHAELGKTGPALRDALDAVFRPAGLRSGRRAGVRKTVGKSLRAGKKKHPL